MGGGGGWRQGETGWVGAMVGSERVLEYLGCLGEVRTLAGVIQRSPEALARPR